MGALKSSKYLSSKYCQKFNCNLIFCNLNISIDKNGKGSCMIKVNTKKGEVGKR